MNFTRIEVLAAGATATTCSEGARPGRTVRMQAPKGRQTGLGVAAENKPRAMNQS